MRMVWLPNWLKMRSENVGDAWVKCYKKGTVQWAAC